MTHPPERLSTSTPAMPSSGRHTKRRRRRRGRTAGQAGPLVVASRRRMWRNERFLNGPAVSASFLTMDGSVSLTQLVRHISQRLQQVKIAKSVSCSKVGSGQHNIIAYTSIDVQSMPAHSNCPPRSAYGTGCWHVGLACD
jgi:hypothetical protein